MAARPCSGWNPRRSPQGTHPPSHRSKECAARPVGARVRRAGGQQDICSPGLQRCSPRGIAGQTGSDLVCRVPEMKQWVGKLEREKTNQTPSTLAAIWGVSEDEATRLADSLVDIGFFERRGTKEDPNYWVPFLYRPALNMIQGTAESEAEEPDLS